MGYTVFDNKPSRGPRSVSNLSFIKFFSSFMVILLLHVLTCSELFLGVSSWQIIVSRATADSCLWENARFVFDLENHGYSFKCLIGWQRDDHDCVEERFNPIKLNEFISWIFSGGVCT